MVPHDRNYSVVYRLQNFPVSHELINHVGLRQNAIKQLLTASVNTLSRCASNQQKSITKMNYNVTAS